MKNNLKQEELERMYALRAGLSVISQKCDDIDKNIQEENFEKGKVDKQRKEVDRLKGVKYDIQDKARHKSYDADSEKKAYKISIAIRVVVAVFFVVSTIVGLSCFLNKAEDWMVISPSCIIIDVILVGVYIFCWRNKYAYKKHLCEREQLLEEVEKQETEIVNQVAIVEDAENKFEIFKQNILDKNKVIKKECNAIYDTIKSEYNDLLDFRDWENLDLVIYYYETGRADSIKEALQLVDKERRNNALIEAIGVATNEICRSIQSLGNVMVAGFNSLSAQLEAQRVQIAGAMSEMVTQQTLNNALLAKANVSSKDMVEQMRELNRKV